VILRISCSVIFLSRLDKERVCFRSEHECRMQGRVDLCNSEVSIDDHMS
jgi:hypothetical protein